MFFLSLHNKVEVYLLNLVLLNGQLVKHNPWEVPDLALHSKELCKIHIQSIQNGPGDRIGMSVHTKRDVHLCILRSLEHIHAWILFVELGQLMLLGPNTRTFWQC